MSEHAMNNRKTYSNGGNAIETYGINWPPFTHGRVVCSGCNIVTARCGCSKGCRVVGTVPHCSNCANGSVKQLPAAIQVSEHEQVTAAADEQDPQLRYIRSSMNELADLPEWARNRFDLLLARIDADAKVIAELKATVARLQADNNRLRGKTHVKAT